MNPTERDRDLYDHSDKDHSKYKSTPGLTRELVIDISTQKKEPEWMLKKLLQAFTLFEKTHLHNWGPNLKDLDLQKIIYYVRPDTEEKQSWDDLPEDIKKTFDRLGIPEAEKKSLSGVGAQYDSDVVYHSLKKEWEDQGVIFENMDVALQKYPELVKKYFMTSCIPITDHKFIMLHAAVWSGGTFIYIPPGVKVKVPLQAYFRMNAKRGGQFEHTLIIADKDSEVQYIEGCSAPQYNASSIHAGCVELHVLEGARIRYSSVENWSKNTYNLNTKRAIVQKNGIIEWINGNLGSGTTMLYPAAILVGENAKCDSLGIALAGSGQNQDTGMKVIHAAPHTSSRIIAKSISKDGGTTTYRGFVHVNKNAINSKVSVNCDALMINHAISNTIPIMKIEQPETHVAHEATVGKIGEEDIFYLMSRGLSKDEATHLIVSGFIEPILKQLPLEYAVELNKLIELEMEGTLG